MSRRLILTIDSFTIASAMRGFIGEPIAKGMEHEIRKRMLKELLAVQSQNQMRKFIKSYIRKGIDCRNLQRLSWEWDFMMLPYRNELHDDYVEKYKHEFDRCLIIEMTEMGQKVRMGQGLKPLSMEDSVQFNTYSI